MFLMAEVASCQSIPILAAESALPKLMNAQLSRCNRLKMHRDKIKHSHNMTTKTVKKKLILRHRNDTLFHFCHKDKQLSSKKSFTAPT